MSEQGSQIIDMIAAYIHKHQLLEPNQELIVAISGGADSVAMLDILHFLGYKCSVAHCNFGLRNEESDGEQIFVNQLAHNYGMPFYTTNFDTKHYCKLHKKSVQQAARDLRYDWFESLMRQLQISKTALAHHAGDQVETLIYRLIKGSGPAGMAAIAPMRGAFVRPLLSISRRQVEKYLSENKLDFCQDSSNLSDAYARNRIRIHVIEQLRIINPNLEQVMSRNAERFAQTNIFLDYAYQTLAKNIFETGKDWIGIDTKQLLCLPGYRVLLHNYLQSYNFDWQKTDALADYIEFPNSNLLSLPDGLEMCKKYPYIYLYKKAAVFPPIILSKSINFAECAYISIKFQISNFFQNKTIKNDTSICIFDTSKLAWPLVLRASKTGDYFFPFDVNKKKNVSEFLVNIGLPRHLRHRVCVISDANNQIVWVVGYQADARFCIDDASKETWVCNWQIK